MSKAPPAAVAKESLPGIALAADPAFRAFVQRLHAAVVAASGSPQDPRVARAEADRLPGATAPIAPSPAPARGAAADAQSPLNILLEPLADSWPAARRAQLEQLSTLVDSVLALWSKPASGAAEVQRCWAPLLDRRDAAVRYASAMFYAMAREARVSEDAIDLAAHHLAFGFGIECYADGSAVFSVPRGAMEHEAQELVGRGHPSGRIRALTFGFRNQSGRVASKATVEADLSTGGTA
jgi:hypothetical protein